MALLKKYFIINGQIALSGGKAIYKNILNIKTNANQNHSMSLGIDGKVWGWGYNSLGFLGNNSTISKLTPVSIHGVNKTFCSIGSGEYHSFALDKNGRVWCWGYNNAGQLGDNSITQRNTPVSIHGANKTFCSIATNGGTHSISIDKNGKIWSWGLNTYGQLGNNSTVSNRTPVSIHGANKTFCSIDGNVQFSVSIDKNGRIWCWGYNSNGQLGDNTVISKNTPVSILGTNKTFCSISVGNHYASTGNHVIAIDKNGRIWSWGQSAFGSLGDNSNIDKCTPVSIHGVNKTFCSIASGNQHSMAIDKNGRIWCWGYNSNGQLGDNSITTKRTPVSIHGVNKTFCQISAGYWHSIGIDKNGNIWSWGYNSNGQLGVNSVLSNRTPVMITTI